MIGKALHAMTAADLQSVIDDEVHEGKRIEYKRQLPGASPEERRESLKHASSFANTDGGGLLLGIEEQAGFLSRYRISAPCSDAPRLDLENRIRNGMHPRPTAGGRAI